MAITVPRIGYKKTKHQYPDPWNTCQLVEHLSCELPTNTFRGTPENRQIMAGFFFFFFLGGGGINAWAVVVSP